MSQHRKGFFGQSVGSLCSVVNSLIVNGAQGMDGRTRSPIELFWTAKNIQGLYIYNVNYTYIYIPNNTFTSVEI